MTLRYARQDLNLQAAFRRRDGLTALDAGTAKALAESKSWDGQLPRITTFESLGSVEIAAALATRKGPLSLPVLKPVAVRYAWAKEHPWANLFNKDGLPALPFSTYESVK
jgi:hypothetical protein